MTTETEPAYDPRNDPGVKSYQPGLPSGVEVIEVGGGKKMQIRPCNYVQEKGPVIVYFPGLGHFNDREMISDHDIAKKCKLVADYFLQPDLPQVGQQLLVLRRAQHRANSLETAALDAQLANPERISNTAVAIVDALFEPMMNDLRTADDPAAAAKRTALDFSRVLLAGHSLGTSYMQQVRNEIVTRLKEKGYDDTQQEQAMHALAAVAFGTVHIVKDRGQKDLPTLHAVMQGDSVAENRAPENAYQLNEDVSPHLCKMRRGTHLYIQPLLQPDMQMRKAQLFPLLPDHAPQEPPRSDLNIKDAQGKVVPQWGITVRAKSDLNKHHERTLTNATRFDGDRVLTLQGSAAAPAIEAFVAEALLASQQASESGIPRDTTQILTHIEEKHLSPDAVRNSARAVRRASAHFEDLVAFSRRDTGTPTR